MESMIIAAMVIGALYLGRTIAIPIAISVLISFLLGPAVSWLRHRNIGRIPSIICVVLPALMALAAFAYLVTTEVGRLAENIPAYESNIEAKISSIQASLPSRELLDRGSAFLRNMRTDSHAAPKPVPGARKGGAGNPFAGQQDGNKPIPVEIRSPDPSPISLLRSILGPIVGPLSDAALVFVFVIFFLAEKEALRNRVIRLAGVKDLLRTTMAMNEAGKRVSRYLLMQTLVNSSFGVAITIGLSILGLPNAALWGGIAAMLRFIPYLGVMAASVLPLALAFAVAPGWSMLLWTGGMFLTFELVVGNVIEPWLYGSSTGLSAVALVLSAIIWTWLWGTIGLLLSTPLTVCIAVIGRYVPQFAFLEVLLGNEATLRPEEAFYQRLLAGDPAEATSNAEDFLKTNPLAAFLDDVAIPALILAEHDRARGALESEQMAQISEGLRLVLEELPLDQPTEADAETPKGQDAVAAEAVEAGSDATASTILCVGGRTELDEAAALLLARLLSADGRTAQTLTHAAALNDTLPKMARGGTVCLSYLDPGGVPHARYLARRLRRRLGNDICLVIAFWGMEPDVMRIEQAKAETAADRIVISLRSAVEAINTTKPAAKNSQKAADSGADLTALAFKASTAVERMAGRTVAQ
jgi:predicted PurR-regulated permease PerM